MWLQAEEYYYFLTVSAYLLLVQAGLANAPSFLVCLGFCACLLPFNAGIIPDVNPNRNVSYHICMAKQ